MIFLPPCLGHSYSDLYVPGPFLLLRSQLQCDLRREDKGVDYGANTWSSTYSCVIQDKLLSFSVPRNSQV